MSDERIKQIRERLEAATPGPWEAFDLDGDYYTQEEWRKESHEMVPAKEAWDVLGPYSMGNGADGAMTRPTATFIANSPADIAYLLAKVERLRQALRRSGDGLVDALAMSKLDVRYLDSIRVLIDATLAADDAGKP